MRKYAITAAVAVAAAGLTVGLTLATRTTVPKPDEGAGGAAAARARPRRAHRPGGGRAAQGRRSLRRAARCARRRRSSRATARRRRRSARRSPPGRRASTGSPRWRRATGAARSSSSTTGSASTGAATRRPRRRPGAWPAGRSRTRSYALRAEDLLYPRFPRGLPTFVPSFLPPPALAKLSPPKQLAYLRAHATDARGHLLLGVAYQRLGRQLSAQREFERASGPEAEVAAGGRALRQGRSLADVLPARPAREALSAQPERPLPPRSLPALARLRSTRPRSSSGSPATSARARRSAPRRADFSSGCRERWFSADTKIGRMAYGARPVRLEHCRLLDRGACLTGHQVTASLSA